MARYEIVGDEVELYFDGKPSYGTRTEMKALRIWWNPEKKCWHGKNSSEVFTLAKRLCGNDEGTQAIPVMVPSVSTSARCCYYASVDEFLSEDKSAWIEKMKASFTESYSMPLGDSQVKAWKDCFDVLKKELPNVNDEHPGLQIIFEYALPYESGRRPDVILLSMEN